MTRVNDEHKALRKYFRKNVLRIAILCFACVLLKTLDALYFDTL